MSPPVLKAISLVFFEMERKERERCFHRRKPLRFRLALWRLIRNLSADSEKRVARSDLIPSARISSWLIMTAQTSPLYTKVVVNKCHETTQAAASDRLLGHPVTSAVALRVWSSSELILRRNSERIRSKSCSHSSGAQFNWILKTLLNILLSFVVM